MGTSWAGCVEGTDGLSFSAVLYLEVSKWSNMLDVLLIHPLKLACHPEAIWESCVEVVVEGCLKVLDYLGQ